MMKLLALLVAMVAPANASYFYGQYLDATCAPYVPNGIVDFLTDHHSTAAGTLNTCEATPEGSDKIKVTECATGGAVKYTFHGSIMDSDCTSDIGVQNITTTDGACHAVEGVIGYTAAKVCCAAACGDAVRVIGGLGAAVAAIFLASM